MSDDLRDRYARALTAEHYRRARAQIVASPEEHSAAMADAVLAVRDEELAKAIAVIKTITDERNDVIVERDALKATTFRVRALLDDPARRYDLIDVHVLRAALDPDTGETETP